MSIDEDFEIENGVLIKYNGSKKNIVIPENVTTIENRAFSSCSSLKSVVIGNNVTTIKKDAFRICRNLKSITIGEGLKEIGSKAFSRCENLSNITINENNPYFSSVNNILYSKDMKEIIFVPETIKGSFTIPSSVTDIKNNAFEECDNLKSITIPDSVTTIKEWAFYFCKNLKSITIGNNVTTIENFAFASCDSLRDIKIPDSVNTLGASVFGSCKNLTSVKLSKNITNIENSCFYDCINLKNITTISSEVLSINDLAFSGCKSLKSIPVDKNNPNFTSIDGILYDKEVKTLIQAPNGIEGSVIIPDSVTSIEDEAFYGCEKLTNIKLPDSLTSIGKHVFSYCVNLNSITVDENNPSFSLLDGILYDKEMKKIIAVPAKIKESVTILNGITNIKEYTFENCTNLKSITLPDSITTIEKSAFEGCTNLESIIIPDSVITIEKGAFKDCESLESIVLSSSITTIAGGILENGIFSNCTSLKSINIPDSVTSIEENAFRDCTNLSDVIIGKGLKTIKNKAFRGCNSLSNISVDESNPYFSSIDGAVYDKDAKTLILVPANTKNQFIIPSSVTTIESEAFASCKNITNITLHSNITSLCLDAFENCQKLNSINADENNPNFTSIDGILYDKEVKTLLLIPYTPKNSLKIPASVTNIKDEAFCYSEDLNSINVDKNNPNFSSLDGVLYDKDMEEILFVPQKIKGSITIADTVLEIDPEIFEYCEDLECLIIPKHLKESFEDFDQCKVITK